MPYLLGDPFVRRRVRSGPIRTWWQPIRVILVVALLLSSMLYGSTRALGYCGGLTSQPYLYGSGGYMQFQDDGGLSEVTGYVQGHYPDPVVSVAAAWNMLARPGGYWAQGGWVRYPNWTTYYVFAQWQSGSASPTTVFQYVTPDLSHNYGVRQISGTTAFDFSYNFSSWVDSLNLGWYPYQLEVAGETHDHGDHFPGSAAPGPDVEFWGSTHTIYGLNYSNNLADLTRTPTYDVVGKTWLSGNDFYVWDKRCTDG